MARVRFSVSMLLVTGFYFFNFLPAGEAQEWFRGWKLEDNVAQAHLILVAKVAQVSQLTVVEGAKTNTTLREYRFQPLKRLKGIFSRDELSMTGADLGCPPEDGSAEPPFKQGEIRLLILAQRQGNFVGCVSAASGPASLDQQVPRLSGPDDPIAAMVEALIQVSDSPSRKKRAELLAASIEKIAGPAVIPLLDSLSRRAEWAAALPALTSSLARLARDASPSIQAAAIRAIAAILDADTAKDPAAPWKDYAAALKDFLESSCQVAEVRSAALRAVGNLGDLARQLEWVRGLLEREVRQARTTAERLAALGALGKIRDPRTADFVLQEFTGLPLDAAYGLENAHAHAALSLDRGKATSLLVDRVKQSLLSEQSIHLEANLLGSFRTPAALPVLLDAARHPAVAAEELPSVAASLGRLKDDRAVKILGEWLRSQNWDLRLAALGALERIGSKAAAEEMRHWIKTEPFLPFKLRMAKVLGRNGFPDGYSLAIEHLSDEEHVLLAAETLGAIQDPRIVPELTAMLQSSRDRHWMAAALSGLIAVGTPSAKTQLQEILKDPRHPIISEAVRAAGLSKDAEFIPLLQPLVESRNRSIQISAIQALSDHARKVRKEMEASGEEAEGEDFLSEIPPPGLLDEGAAENGSTANLRRLAPALSTLLVDPYVEEDVRLNLLRLFRQLKGEEFRRALKSLCDQAEIEGKPLLAQAQNELRRHRIPLQAP